MEGIYRVNVSVTPTDRRCGSGAVSGLSMPSVDQLIGHSTASRFVPQPYPLSIIQADEVRGEQSLDGSSERKTPPSPLALSLSNNHTN